MSVNLMAILPEILLLILAVLILVIDPFWKNINRRINLGWLTVGGLAVVALISILVGRGNSIVDWEYKVISLGITNTIMIIITPTIMTKTTLG